MPSKNLDHYLLHDQVKNETGIAVHDREVKVSCGLHWHNFLELELITDGEGEQLLCGHKQTLTRGSLSVIRLTDFHQVAPKNNLHLINLMVNDKFLSEEMLGKITAGHIMYFKLSESETCIFEQLLKLCIAENDQPSPDHRYLKHLLICIFLRILRLAPDVKGRSAEGDRPIQTALLYIHMHFRENPSLKEVAKIAHYNASHFSTTFHKELGMTYCDYLNILKIAYAKELLISTDLKITDVCFKCGFTSHSNFLRLFKDEIGLSPLQFRKRAIDKSAV